MIEAPKYGKTRVSRVLADIHQLRAAIRAHDDEAAEQAWEKVERWTGFIAGSVSRTDTIAALEAENQRLREAVAAADELARQMDEIEKEAGREFEYGEEDPIRMLDWFDTEWIRALERFRSARAELEGK